MTDRQRFEKWLEEVHGLYGSDIDWEPERNCYRIFGIHLAHKAWQAATETPVILPPMIDITGLEGEHLNAANHFNAAIAMCSIAIRKAGYPSECSPMFYPTDKKGG